MQPEDRAQLKEKIFAEIEETKKAIKKLRELAKPVSPDNALGRLTRMDAMQTQKLNEAALQKNEGKLEALNRALEKSEETNFGSCQKCGNSINPKRLMLLPESPFCVNCAN